MSFGEYIGSGAATTKLLLHLNGSSADSSGNSYTIADTAITYSKANGKFNEGTGFAGAGSTSRIVINDDNNLDLTSFFISFWIKVASMPNGAILSKFQAGATGSTNFLIDCSGASNSVRFILGNTVGTVTNVRINAALPTGVWNNVAFSVGANVIKGYMNGKELLSSTYTGTVNTNAYPLVVGARYQPATSPTFEDYLTGQLDEIIIENATWDYVKYLKYYTNSLGRF
jgi:hypothetical protein